jgi:glutamyl-tRNA(Gln) amidotransferase subunit E
MTKKEDWKMKCGIEIHQQLDTHKLFCNCPSILRQDEPEFTIMRKLHAVAGEGGEIDIAAKHEATIDKEFIYQGYDTTCLVELDEEPPHLINKDALKIALHIALHLNCEVLPIAQVMRKTVVNGSNTGGFQRTALIARNGFIETKFGRVGITGVMLEEDSARPVLREKDKTIYRLDRLGIPLVEIATDPDIKSPEQAKEVALFIGDVLRSCKVKRGIGTIRQDINLSSSGHPRVEIKGFQDVKLFESTIEKELERQKNLSEIYNELVKRKAEVGEIIDVTNILKNTNCNFVKKSLEEKGVVLGVKLKGFKTLLGKELHQNKRFGSELSEHAKTAGVNGIIHSDEKLEKYEFNDVEINEIKDKLKIKKDDSFILIVDGEKRARNAIDKVIKRARDQIDEIGIGEVRNAKEDSSSKFMRPMPGSARMYPETDHPLIKIDRQLLNEVKENLPRLRSEIHGELKEKGLSPEMLKLLSHGDKIEEFTTLCKIMDDPNFVARAMFLIPRDLATKNNLENIDDILTLDVIESVINLVRDKKLEKGDVRHVYEQIINGKSYNDAIKIKKADIGEIETEIIKLVKEKPGLSIGGYMGLIMSKFKGKVDGKTATSILQKLINPK